MPAPLTCCQTNWMHRFCGHCGKDLGDGPLYELLGHCRTTLASAEKALATRRRDLVDIGGGHRDAAQFAKWVRCSERTIAKWTAWTDALERLIEENQTTDATNGG